MEIFYFQHIKGKANIVVRKKNGCLKSYFTFLPFSYIYVNFVGAALSVLGSGLLAIEPKCFLRTNPFQWQMWANSVRSIMFSLLFVPVSFASRPLDQVLFLWCAKYVDMFSLAFKPTKATSVAFIWHLCNQSNSKVRLCPCWTKPLSTVQFIRLAFCFSNSVF